MAIIVEERTKEVRTRPLALTRPGGASYQAFSLLYVAYVTAPILAGVDKFLKVLVDWNIYASPAMASLFGENIPLMMNTVGIIEIIAGLIVAIKPRVGGMIVALWLGGIIINLMLLPGHFDIALRDFGLMLGALALSRLSVEFSN